MLKNLVKRPLSPSLPTYSTAALPTRHFSYLAHAFQDLTWADISYELEVFRSRWKMKHGQVTKLSESLPTWADVCLAGLESEPISHPSQEWTDSLQHYKEDIFCNERQGSRALSSPSSIFPLMEYALRKEMEKNTREKGALPQMWQRQAALEEEKEKEEEG